MVFAFVFSQLVQGGRIRFLALTYDQTWTLPTGVALLVVVGVLAPAFGWGLDRALVRRLRGAGEVVKIVATIGLLVALQGVAGLVWGAATTLTPISIAGEGVIRLGGVRVSLEQVVTVVVVAVLASVSMAFLRWSPLGIRMRAVVDRADLAELAGVDARRVSAASWAVGTSFGALSGILTVPFFGSLDPLTLTFFVVAATAAAVAGRLESFPLTLAGGIGIGMAQQLVQRYASQDIGRQLRPSIPFLVLFALLFLPQWKRRPKDRFEAPPLPPLANVFSRTEASLRAGVAVALGVSVVFLLNAQWQVQLSRVPAVAVIFLSLVVVSGYGGQVSLCQGALAGLGAFVTAHLVADLGVPFLVAVAVGGLAVVPVGVFLSLRAVSLSPLFLGLATLAFGAVMDEVAFASRSFSGGLSGIFFQRPGFLSGPRAYYLFGVAVFAVCAVVVQNLRRSETGLALAAMRDSEMGLGSVGVDVARLKLVAFSLSALLAGVGGGLLSGADELATPFSYFKFQSLLFLALAVVGGVGSWTGALAGAIIFQLLPPFVHESFIRENALTTAIFGDQLEALLPVFFGLGAIGLARSPLGLVEQVRASLSRRTAPAVEATEPDGAQPDGDGLVTFTRATFYHREGCVLTTGKQAQAVTTRTRRSIQACPVCEPPTRP